MLEPIPLFEQRCKATFDAACATFRERGDQYGDTWRDCQWLALRAVIFQMFGLGLKPTTGQCRALAAAALVDVKHQRFQGGWNPDHAIDGINYQALLAEEMRQIWSCKNGLSKPGHPERMRGTSQATHRFPPAPRHA